MPGQVCSPEKEGNLVNSPCIKAGGDDVLLARPNTGDDCTALVDSSEPNEHPDEMVQSSGKAGLVSPQHAVQGQRESQAHPGTVLKETMEAPASVPVGQEEPPDSFQGAQELCNTTLPNPIHACGDLPGGDSLKIDAPLNPSSGQSGAPPAEAPPAIPHGTQRTALGAPPSPRHEPGQCSSQLADDPSSGQRNSQSLQQSAKNKERGLWNPLVAFLHAGSKAGTQADGRPLPAQVMSPAKHLQEAGAEKTLEKQNALGNCSGAHLVGAQAGLRCGASLNAAQAPSAPGPSKTVQGLHPQIESAGPQLPSQAISHPVLADSIALSAMRKEPAPQAACGTVETIAEDANCMPDATVAADPAAAPAHSGNGLGHAKDGAPAPCEADPNTGEASESRVVSSHASERVSEPQDQQVCPVPGRKSAHGKGTKETTAGVPSTSLGKGTGKTGQHVWELLPAQTSGVSPLEALRAAAIAGCHGSGAASVASPRHAAEHPESEPPVERPDGEDPAPKQAFQGILLHSVPSVRGLHVSGLRSRDCS